MQVYGSSENLSSFTRYGLQVLEEAGMDYHKALPGVEIYLGEVFTERIAGEDVYQIYDTGIDMCRMLLGEKGVKTRINSFLGYELGVIIQKTYLPKDSPKWREIERMLGQRLDFNEYFSRLDEKKYCPAEETAASLFDGAIKGHKEFTFRKIVSSGSYYSQELEEEVLIPRQVKNIRLKSNPHLWRKWFFNLWGQPYEWGYFIINEKMAMANEHIYYFDMPPQIINKRSFLPVRYFLEAHGFKVSYGKNGRVEYWR